MTTPPEPSRWSTHGLRRLATSMTGQEHVGILGGLLIRLARFLQGDPALQFIATSANFATPATLPDNTVASTAVLHVQGNPCNYRVDGQQPNGNDPLLPVGSVITLTGTPTIKGFVFVSSSVGASNLTGAYFD